LDYRCFFNVSKGPREIKKRKINKNLEKKSKGILYTVPQKLEFAQAAHLYK
jgi:hypothetical protein